MNEEMIFNIWHIGKKLENKSYLFLLLVEVVNDDTNEEVQGEERAKDDEDDKVDVHVQVVLVDRLVLHL